jgi:hypothetical protein
VTPENVTEWVPFLGVFPGKRIELVDWVLVELVTSENWNVSVDPVQVFSQNDFPVNKWATDSISFGVVISVFRLIGFLMTWVVVGVLRNDLDLGNNVLVEKDRVVEVGFECRQVPELLEERRSNIASEDNWVFFPELTEERNVVVFSKERMRDDFLKGHNCHPAVVVWEICWLNDITSTIDRWVGWVLISVVVVEKTFHWLGPSEGESFFLK